MIQAKDKVKVELASPKLVPFFLKPSRYKCCYGGRGSGKTRSFAIMTAIKAYQLSQAGKTGKIVIARQFMNSLEDSSFSEIADYVKSTEWLAPFFDIGRNYIRTADGRVVFSFVGLQHNLDSIKSKGAILICWCDEAETITAEAWRKLTPTVRKHNSEIWVTWNPEYENSPTHIRFRVQTPTDCQLLELNWEDNTYFPEVLNLERLDDLKYRPDEYDHIWNGGFRTVVTGAYYTRWLQEAKSKGRICSVQRLPVYGIDIFCDIGGTGMKSDHFVFVVTQRHNSDIRIIDHYEVRGQPIEAHVNWLRQHGYTPQIATIHLPHDGRTRDRVFDVSYESELKRYGYSVHVIPNQGKGAALQRIDAGRRIFERLWFDKVKTVGLIKALERYREQWDDKRNIGLGALHDEYSNSADAFGYMAITFNQNKTLSSSELEYPSLGGMYA